MIKLISFDLWNTIIEDDKDLEDKRGEVRIKKIYEYLSPLKISLKRVKDAYREMSEWLFLTQAKTRRAIDVDRQIIYILKKFGVRVNRIVFESIKNSYERAIFLYPPPLVNGAKETLKKFKKLGIDMCIISDAGRTPGWALRETLKNLGIDGYFKRMYFSDELGWVKPNRRVFLKAIKDFNIKREEMVHIGDSLEKDIEGAKKSKINYIYFSRENDCKVKPCAKNFSEIYKVFFKNFSFETPLFY